MSGALTFAPPRCVVTLPYPDRRLSINGGRLHPALRARLRDEAKEAAGWAAKAAIPADARPVYPAGVPLLVVVTMERPRHGKQWDTAGVIEALKPQADALNGIAWADDKQIVGWIVRWDTQPTHKACIHLAVYECMEITT